MIMLEIFIPHVSEHVLVLHGNYNSVVLVGDIHMGQWNKAVCTEQT